MRLTPLLLLMVLLAACLPTAFETIPPTDTPLSPTPTTEATATPTVVWFPPTPTFTPFPTPVITPTVDLRTGLGEVLLSDDFATAEKWALTSNPEGSVALSKGELTVAIQGAKAYLFSIRDEPVLTDFYAEITANPNLCKGGDEYGMLLRATSSEDFYRFSLSCDSQVRLDRVVGSAASSPQPWILSGDVPPGAPSVSRLAVWAVGSEMRFFVNGQHQFTVTDPLLPSGKLGIFARSTGANAVTVNFSDLVVRAINQ